MSPPELDDRAVAAAASVIVTYQQRYDTPNQDHLNEAHDVVAAYFAALDREPFRERIAAVFIERGWRADIADDFAPLILEALGLFTPDTEEPT